jgi:hypothetical protein
MKRNVTPCGAVAGAVSDIPGTIINMATRTSRPTGATALSAADIDPVAAARAAEAAAGALEEANAKDNARTVAARVTASTGWACTATAMTVTCTKDGHVPLVVHRSSLTEAADAAIFYLSDGTDRTLTADTGRDSTRAEDGSVENEPAAV